MSTKAKQSDDAQKLLAEVEEIGNNDELDVAGFTPDGIGIPVNVEEMNSVWFVAEYYPKELAKLKTMYLYDKLQKK